MIHPTTGINLIETFCIVNTVTTAEEFKKNPI